MIVILDVLLFLALVGTIVGSVAMRQPSGPEGPVGVWVLLVFPCLLAAVVVFVLAARGSLNLVVGGRVVQFAIATGILITFCTAVFGALERHNAVIQGFLVPVPYLILAGCAAAIHHSDLPDPGIGRWAAALVLGGTALTGWVLAGRSVFLFMQRDMERATRQEQRERDQEGRYEKRDVDEYAALDASPPLQALLRFTWSRSEPVRRQARARVSGTAGLDDTLIELVDRDYEDAISYIANVYEDPPAKLAPAWGRMLERKLIAWNTLQFDEHAGTWEQNLRPYFVGAQKIQLSGESLHSELLSWHQHLQRCRGLGNLTDFVGSLLSTNSQS